MPWHNLSVVLILFSQRWLDATAKPRRKIRFHLSSLGLGTGGQDVCFCAARGFRGSMFIRNPLRKSHTEQDPP